MANSPHSRQLPPNRPAIRAWALRKSSEKYDRALQVSEDTSVSVQMQIIVGSTDIKFY